jgi:putative ABC transport system substrate-binding protein
MQRSNLGRAVCDLLILSGRDQSGGCMRRRKFIAAASSALLVVPGRALAQSPTPSYRLGWLNATNTFGEPQHLAFVDRLAQLGFNDGRNLTIERRHADSKLDMLPAMAAELAGLKCDILFGSGLEASLAALVNASRDTPIVFVAVDFDPVATGDVASLARPGGRVTGVTALQSELPAKRLELLTEMLPGVSKVAVFTNEQTSAQLSLVQGTARRIGLPLHVADFKRPPFDYEAGFAEAVQAKADALIVLGSGLWVPARHKIAELALKSQLRSSFHHSQWTEAGGLMSYGFNFPWMWRRAADMVADIIRGAKAGDIPMQQPTQFELVINLKTAKALGLTAPATLLARADAVIE